MSTTPPSTSSLAAFDAAASAPVPPPAAAAAAAPAAGRGRRVSKAKLPANEIVPGPIAPPGHPNFVQHTTAVKKVSTTSKRGTSSSTSSSAKVKTTLAVSGSDHVEKGSDKSKGGGGGPHISVSITNKLVSLGGEVPKGKSPESLLKSFAEEVDEDEEKWEEAAEDTSAAAVAAAQTVPKTVIEVEEEEENDQQQQQQPMDTTNSLTLKQKAAPEPTEPFQLLYDPELPSSAEGLKQHFVDNIADSLEDNKKARALCEHLLAMLKLSE